MKIDIITAFGDMVDQALSQSIVGRARKAGIIKLGTLSPREFTADKHKTIDDRPYGGGFFNRDHSVLRMGFFADSL